MSRSVAKTAEMYENAAVMVAEHRQDPVKCMMPYVHSVERKHKFRSNLAMIGRFCAGTASPRAAGKNVFTVRTELSGLFLFSAEGGSAPSSRKIDQLLTKK